MLAIAACASALATGIDQFAPYDNGGIWKRRNQQIVEVGLIGGEITGASWLGDEDRWARPSGSRPHGQGRTDVLTSLALGTGTRYLAHARDSPITPGLLPYGIAVGAHAQF